MNKIGAGRSATVFLPSGGTLDVEGIGTGTIVRLRQSGHEPYSPISYNGGGRRIGPFDEVATYQLNCVIGEIEYEVNAIAHNAAAFSDNVLVVREIDDLPDPVGDECILPNKTVLIAGNIDLGSDALRLSTGTLLRGLGGDSITSSNVNGVIRASNLNAAVVMREVSVIAPNGPCIDLTGAIDHQLNMFFIAFIGHSVGTVSGFDVQAMKDCYVNAADGVRFAGTTNKAFVSRSPFYGITSGNAAITLDAALNARRVDIETNFFKHDSTGISLRAETGYTVGYGRVRGSMLDGPTTMLEGLTAEDENWFFIGNDLVRDSRVSAEAYLITPTTTPITMVGTFVPVVGNFTVTDLTQRFVLDTTNHLRYTGKDPVLVTFNVSVTTDPAFSDEIAFRADKNGVTLPESQIIVVQGSGTAAQPRNGSLNTLIELVNGDVIGLQVANQTTTSDILMRVINFSVTA